MIIVKKISGSICVQPDDGKKLQILVSERLAGSKDVVVDFSGVETLTSSFLNVGIGALYGIHDEKSVDAVEYIGLDDGDLALLKVVVKNAKRFYSLSTPNQNSIIADSEDILGD